MITMTVQGADYAEIRTKLAAMFEPHVRIDLGRSLPEKAITATDIVNAGPADRPLTVAETIEIEPKKKAGRPRKSETEAALPTVAPIAPEASAPVVASSAPAAAPPVSAPAAVEAPTYEGLKAVLQKYVAQHKTTEAGMDAVSKLLGTFGAQRVKDVPAEKWGEVIAATQALLTA